jgi:hypothetical protein
MLGAEVVQVRQPFVGVALAVGGGEEQPRAAAGQRLGYLRRPYDQFIVGLAAQTLTKPPAKASIRASPSLA